MSYQEAVLNVFKGLHDVSWPIFVDNDFWHTANTLDTCIDFVLEGSTAWKDFDRYQQVQNMIENSYLFFDKKYDEENKNGQQSPNIWWDDYGWWGITFTKIYEHYDQIFKGPESPKVTRQQCLQAARKCWSALGDYSNDVNENLEPPLKGPIAGGVWNHPPLENAAGGIQNTVTNGLFLVLCARLYRNTKEQEFLYAAAAQYLWFRNWFVNYLERQPKCEFPGTQLGLFRCLPSSGQDKPFLVYERPIDPANPDYNQGNPAFSKDQWWAGDQGLFLGGMAEVLDLQEQLWEVPTIKDDDPTFPENAQNMLQWVASGIAWLFDPTQVLHEATLHGQFRSNYAADMATGKGVMMRYLNYAMRKAELDPKPFIERSAVAVISSLDDDHQVSFWWNDRTDTKLGTNEQNVQHDDPRFLPTAQSAGLDALNAAIQYVKESTRSSASAAD